MTSEGNIFSLINPRQACSVSAIPNYGYGLILLLLWGLVVGGKCHPIMGQTYYLHPAGNDMEDGLSPQTAWQSLNRLNQEVFVPGDSILLAGGARFQGSLYFEPGESGTAQNPITISSYGDGIAVIEADSSTGIYIHNGAGFRLERLEVVGAGRAQNDGHGVLFYLDADQPYHQTGLWLNQIKVHGFNLGGVTVYASDSVDRGYELVRMTHIDSYDNGDHGISLGGKVRDSGYVHRDIIIRDCRAYDNPGQLGKDWAHTGNGIVIGNSEEVLVEYCQAYRNGGESYNTTGGPVGIWFWDTRAGIIQHCESHHNDTGSAKDGGGFDLDGGCVDCVIQYCYAHDNAGPGYLLAAYNGARPLRHCQIRHNISENDARKNYHGSVVLWRGNAVLEDIDVYHNTLYLSETSMRSLPVVWISSGGMERIRIMNNVIMAGDYCLVAHSVSGAEAVQFTGNAYESTGPFKVKMSGTTYTSLAAWRAATVQEIWQGQPFGLSGAMLLQAPGQGGTLWDPYKIPEISAYRLWPDSPLREAAWAGHGVDPGSQDALGQALGDMPHDIGAVQFSETLGMHPQRDTGLSLTRVDDHIQIGLPASRPATGRVELLDLQGRLWRNWDWPQGQREYVLDLKGYTAGSFIIRLIQADWVGVGKGW